MIGVDHMHPDVVLNDLSHQAVHCSSRGNHEMQNVGAALFFFDRTFQRFHLTADAAYSIQELGLFFDGVAHC